MKCKCGNWQLGFDCVCDWVSKNPGKNEYSCSWCGFYSASRPRCNECTPAEEYPPKSEDHQPIVMNREEKKKEKQMAETAKAPRFLVEIKFKKDVIYSCTISSQNKKTAEEWGRQWIKVNHRDAECKVTATEVHAPAEDKSK